MNHNRKRRETEARESRRREAKERQRQEDLKNAVLVDPTALAPSNSLDRPDFVERGYYLDFPFTCVSCGSEEVWTATQQKWWYEEAKGSLDSGANMCRTCRQEARRTKGMAHPLQSELRWLGRFRDQLEPALSGSGWTPMAGVGESRPTLLSYLRGDVLVRLRWEFNCDGGTLILERRDTPDSLFQPVCALKCTPRKMTFRVLEQRFDSILAAVRHELELESKA